MSTAPLYLRVRWITENVGVSKPKVLAAIKSGRLKAMKLDGVLLVPYEAFQDWIASAVPVEPEL